MLAVPTSARCHWARPSVAVLDQQIAGTSRAEQSTPRRHRLGEHGGESGLAVLEPVGSARPDQAKREGQPGADGARRKGERPAAQEQPAGEGGDRRAGGERRHLFDGDMPGIAPRCAAKRACRADQRHVDPSLAERDGASQADDTIADDDSGSGLGHERS
jgi:hypothetical protein